jgi:hypothetical protein
MNEERVLAKTLGYESPVWDTIEETHKCYNANMLLLFDNIKKEEAMFVASHNT